MIRRVLFHLPAHSSYRELAPSTHQLHRHQDHRLALPARCVLNLQQQDQRLFEAPQLLFPLRSTVLLQVLVMRQATQVTSLEALNW
jgi:hypothetical protein